MKQHNFRTIIIDSSMVTEMLVIFHFQGTDYIKVFDVLKVKSTDSFKLLSSSLLQRILADLKSIYEKLPAH